MPFYTPYSVRNKITDKDLGALLDYLEREMGWDISIKEERLYLSISSGDNMIYIKNRSHKHPKVFLRTGVRGKGYELVGKNSFDLVHKMDLRLFYKTYRNLIPAIRDLYSTH